MLTSFLVQQRDARRRWRTVTAARARSTANGLAQELRRALVANPYTPAAEVRVISDIELAHEMRISSAAGEEFGRDPDLVVDHRTLAGVS
jgi:hypothetical protein